MIAIFEVGTIWFGLLVCVISIVLMVVQENAEYPIVWSTFWVVVTFAALYWCGAGLSMRELGLHIWHNPVETLVYFLLYTIVGVLWSFYKWSEVVSRAVELFNKDVEKFNKADINYNAPNWDDKYKNNRRKPQLEEHKGEIFNWIFYWPFSFAWFVVHEPIQRLFRFIMKTCKQVYEGITNRATKRLQTPKSDDMVH